MTEWLKKTEGRTSYDWRHVRGTTKTVWGQPRGFSHGQESVINGLSPDLIDYFVDASTESSLQKFVAILRHGTRDEQHRAVQAALVIGLDESLRQEARDRVLARLTELKAIVLTDESNRVVRVDLTASSANDQDLQQMKALIHVQYLKLGRTAITDQSMPALVAMIQLRKLDLSATKITDESLPMIGKLTHLQELDLSWTDVSAKALLHLSDLTRLQRLRFNNPRAIEAITRGEVRMLLKTEQGIERLMTDPEYRGRSWLKPGNPLDELKQVLPGLKIDTSSELRRPNP